MGGFSLVLVLVLGITFLVVTAVLIVLALLPNKILHNIARTMLLLGINGIVQFVFTIRFYEILGDFSSYVAGFITIPVLLAGVLTIWQISTPKTRKIIYIGCALAFVLAIGLAAAISSNGDYLIETLKLAELSNNH
jgi:hypothetical protein